MNASQTQKRVVSDNADIFTSNTLFENVDVCSTCGEFFRVFSFYRFLQSITHTFTVISLIGNALLLTVLAHNHSKNIGSYRELLIMFTIVDVFSSLSHSFCVPVSLQNFSGHDNGLKGVLLSSTGYIFYSNNWIAHGEWSFWAMVFVGVGVGCSFMLITLHFLYRYFSLCA